MAAVSLFWDTNMAAVTSCENTLYISRTGLVAGLSFRNNENAVFVFEITKTKIPKFTVKFDLKLGGKNQTEDNLTDYTYFGYNLNSYFDRFDFMRS